MLEAPLSFGDYEVLGRLKSGGMAQLYRGQRLGTRGFRREVAIKVVHDHLSDDESFERMFEDEARVMMHLSHPNIVRTEAFGEQDGACYLIMEMIEGCSLTTLLKGLRRRGELLPVPTAVRIACDIAAALHHAHEAADTDGTPLGIVHRDITPGNVLLTVQGHTKVIDFGIAASSLRSEVTNVGTFKGKFRYMAPEQAHGHGCDRRADIYCLGLVLWELLVGRPAIEASTDLEALQRAREPSISSARLMAPDRGIREDLDDVLDAMLRANPRNRPSTARELRRKLLAACPEAAVDDERLLADLVQRSSQTGSTSSTALTTLDASVRALPDLALATSLDVEELDVEVVVDPADHEPGVTARASSSVRLPWATDDQTRRPRVGRTVAVVGGALAIGALLSLWLNPADSRLTPEPEESWVEAPNSAASSDESAEARQRPSASGLAASVSQPQQETPAGDSEPDDTLNEGLEADPVAPRLGVDMRTMGRAQTAQGEPSHRSRDRVALRPSSRRSEQPRNGGMGASTASRPETAPAELQEPETDDTDTVWVEGSLLARPPAPF